jgi:hypothetical protein
MSLLLSHIEIPPSISTIALLSTILIPLPLFHFMLFSWQKSQSSLNPTFYLFHVCPHAPESAGEKDTKMMTAVILNSWP